jgi:hypothetical protein
MAIQGPLKVDFGDVFPHGAYLVGAVEPVRDFEASSAGSAVQGRDKASGLPLWQVDVLDADPEARERTLRVKIAASVQPVPPETIAGVPFRPVELDGLTVTPYVKESGQGRARVGYSLRASGMRAPKATGSSSTPAASPKSSAA